MPAGTPFPCQPCGVASYPRFTTAACLLLSPLVRQHHRIPRRHPDRLGRIASIDHHRDPAVRRQVKRAFAGRDVGAVAGDFHGELALPLFRRRDHELRAADLAAGDFPGRSSDETDHETEPCFHAVRVGTASSPEEKKADHSSPAPKRLLRWETYRAVLLTKESRDQDGWDG